MTKTEETKSLEYRRYCDVCRIKVGSSYDYTWITCTYCGKDLCKKHIGHEESSFGEDSRTIWCKDCWTLGKEYIPEINRLLMHVAQLYMDWKTRCMAMKNIRESGLL